MESINIRDNLYQGPWASGMSASGVKIVSVDRPHLDYLRMTNLERSTARRMNAERAKRLREFVSDYLFRCHHGFLEVLGRNRLRMHEAKSSVWLRVHCNGRINIPASEGGKSIR
jgi:hypothetical protein